MNRSVDSALECPNFLWNVARACFEYMAWWEDVGSMKRCSCLNTRPTDQWGDTSFFSFSSMSESEANNRYQRGDIEIDNVGLVRNAPAI
jgi:hypothetical protein